MTSSGRISNGFCCLFSAILSALIRINLFSVPSVRWTVILGAFAMRVYPPHVIRTRALHLAQLGKPALRELGYIEGHLRVHKVILG